MCPITLHVPVVLNSIYIIHKLQHIYYSSAMQYSKHTYNTHKPPHTRRRRAENVREPPVVRRAPPVWPENFLGLEGHGDALLCSAGLRHAGRDGVVV